MDEIPPDDDSAAASEEDFLAYAAETTIMQHGESHDVEDNCAAGSESEEDFLGQSRSRCEQPESGELSVSTQMPSFADIVVYRPPVCRKPGGVRAFTRAERLSLEQLALPDSVLAKPYGKLASVLVAPTAARTSYKLRTDKVLAEFCGLQHSKFKSTLHGITHALYQTWHLHIDNFGGYFFHNFWCGLCRFFL